MLKCILGMIYVYFEADNIQRAVAVVPREVLCHIHLSSGLCCDTSVTTGP